MACSLYLGNVGLRPANPYHSTQLSLHNLALAQCFE